MVKFKKFLFWTFPYFRRLTDCTFKRGINLGVGAAVWCFCKNATGSSWKLPRHTCCGECQILHITWKYTHTFTHTLSNWNHTIVLHQDLLFLPVLSKCFICFYSTWPSCWLHFSYVYFLSLCVCWPSCERLWSCCFSSLSCRGDRSVSIDRFQSDSGTDFSQKEVSLVYNFSTVVFLPEWGPTFTTHFTCLSFSITDHISKEHTLHTMNHLCPTPNVPL